MGPLYKNKSNVIRPVLTAPKFGRHAFFCDKIVVNVVLQNIFVFLSSVVLLLEYDISL